MTVRHKCPPLSHIQTNKSKQTKSADFTQTGFGQQRQGSNHLGVCLFLLSLACVVPVLYVSLESIFRPCETSQPWGDSDGGGGGAVDCPEVWRPEIRILNAKAVEVRERERERVA